MNIMNVLKELLTTRQRVPASGHILHPHDEAGRARAAQLRVSRRRVRFTADGARIFRKRPMAAWKGGC